MVLFDATTLLLLFAPDANVPKDSAGNVITFAKERIDGLLVTLAKGKTQIIVPTPALSETLVRAGQVAGSGYLSRMRKSAWFRIEPFDERAAVEVALMTKTAIDNGGKKGGIDATWAKIKFDRQIVAIAKVNGVSAIYSDDNNLRSFAASQGVRVISVSELSIPDETAQTDWVKNLNEQANTESEKEESTGE